MDIKNIKELPSSWKWRITRAGETQDSFALKAGVSLASLNKAITGKADPQLSTVDKIEKALAKLEKGNFYSEGE